MRHKFVLAAILCLALVAMMALTVAPAASAHPRVIHWTATETFVEQNVVSQKTVGDVTIVKMRNHLSDSDAKDALSNPVPMGNAKLYTKGTWVIVDTDPSNAIMTGTYRAVAADRSIWLGEWAGTMDMTTGAQDYVGWGRAVRGPARGMLLYTHGVNPGGFGAVTTVTQTALRLCWSPWEH